MGKLLTTCLGLLLGAPFKSPSMWDVVEERFHRRLALWKRQYLSKGSRLALFKSTLCSLAIYFMSLLVIPKMLALRLEKIQQNFLWGGGALEKRHHLEKWSSMCKDKKLGGLHIKVLSFLNKVLLGKWCWRFALEREFLWRRVIVGKFGEEPRGWCSLARREGYGVGLWKVIRGGWEAFKVSTSFIVSNGRRTKFWHDVWCGDAPLKDPFLSCFSFASNKEV